MAVQFVNGESFVFFGPKKPTSEWVAANQTVTLITRAIKRPRKHTNSLPILHGTHVRKHALASQTVTPHWPMRCAWAFVTPRRPNANTHRRVSRLNTHATTQHHSQGCNFPIHFPDSLNPPFASVPFWVGGSRHDWGLLLEQTDLTRASIVYFVSLSWSAKKGGRAISIPIYQRLNLPWSTHSR